jgi:hypothetical protein
MKIDIIKIKNRIAGSCLLLLFISSITFTSCEDFIDIDEYVYDKATIDTVFQSKTRTLEYIIGTAGLLKNESNFVGDWDYRADFPSGMGTDEAIQPWINWDHAGSCLVVDQVTPRDTKNVNPWPDYYKGIRKANIILERIDENPELTDAELRDYKDSYIFYVPTFIILLFAYTDRYLFCLILLLIQTQVWHQYHMSAPLMMIV